MNRIVQRAAVVAVAMAAAIAAPRVSVAGFDPSEETPGLGNQLTVLQLEVKAQSAGAAKRLAEMWSGSGRGLVKLEDGSTVSMAGWLEGVTDRAALTKTLDAAGKWQALPVVQASAADAGTSVLDLYAKARSVAASTDMGDALAIVADRALARGDVTSADELYTAAKAAGWTSQPARSIDLGALKNIVTPATAVQTVAPWFGDPKALLLPHVLPVTVGDTAYVAGTAGMVAIKGGAVRWTNKWGDADDITASAPVPGGAGRGPYCHPAVLAANGAAQILIVNTPATAELPGTLRAVRAGDGRTLWDSQDDDANAAMRFVGPVTIAGRYVYAPAVSSIGASTTLMLACLDVTNGRSLWQASLGTVVDTAGNNNRRPLEHHWHQSEPLVSGEHVYVAPGVGYVFSIGRFDGIVRWARPYETADADENEVRRFREEMRYRATAMPPIHPLQALRYVGGLALAGDVLVAAPLDTPGAMGLDVTTGKVLWERKELDPPTLVGIVGGNAIFVGATVAGLDPATGQNKWATDANTVTCRGAVTLAGDQIAVPVEAGVQAIAANGAMGPVSPYPLTAALKSEATRAALTSIGALSAIELPPVKK